MIYTAFKRHMIHKTTRRVFRLACLPLVVLMIGIYAQPMSVFASSQYETRAEFVQSLDQTLNISPVYPSTPDFTDVPVSSSYYGYIEAAYQAGWISGVGGGLFDPNGLLTRAQVAKIEVLALGLGSTVSTMSTQSSQFTDAQQIPSWALGYVNEAAKIGILKGEPSGVFDPSGNLTTVQESFVLSQLLTYKSSQSPTVAESLSVSAPAQVVAGIPFWVTLSIQGNQAYNGTDSIQVGSPQTDNGASLPTAATFTNGTATVTLTLTKAQSDTITITDETQHIQGTVSLTVESGQTVSGLEVSAPATATVGTPFTATLTLQDAYQNTVAFTGSASITVTMGQDQNAIVPSYATFQNGVATIQITPSVAGDNILVVSYANGGATATGLSQPISVQGQSMITITFNANGGLGFMSSEVEPIYDYAYLTTNAFTLTGYNFSGWNTVSNGSGASFSNNAYIQFTGSMTLFAQWTPSSPQTQFTGWQSQNWSGYILPNSASVFTDVSAQWIVPTLNCTDTSNGYTSIWVGTGGWPSANGGTSGALLQTGTNDTCVNGTQQDYGWWELWPNIPSAQRFSGFPVSPGDSMEASVFQMPNGSWETLLTDLTTGLSAVMVTGEGWGVAQANASTFTYQGTTTTLSYSGGYTAEWIVEDPGNATDGGYFPFANYGTITFTNLETNLSSGVLSGNDAVEMLNAGGFLLSVPGSVSNDGFTVTYTGP